ncbi:MAG TPA: hypothetical protein VL947_05460, partial [Cytophagales bacterium]|nr:hypothetical protein [Cytophagales bacterium]
TDDWYLTKSWRQQVMSSTTGRAVIRNGLMAYSLFQDWGNSPTEYTSGDKQSLHNLTKLAFAATNATIPATAQLTEIERLLGLNSDETPIKWHFKVATGPTYTLFLDTRTRRQFDRMTSAPGLLQSSAMEEQIPSPESLQNPEAIFIVSPAPVLGMALFEEVVQSFKVKAASQDFEAWSFNNNTFEKFLDRIQAFKKVILLSGDVHYGFTMSMDYWKKKKAPSTGYSVSKIIQLVSSACKNETDMVPAPIFINARINQLQSEGLLPAKRLGWANKLAVSVTGDVTFSNRMRLKKEPVLLSPGPSWIDPPGSNANSISPEPDWAWQFDAIMDVRAETARPENIRMTVIADDSGYATNKKEFYEKVMERHIENSKKHVSRRFVWNNNLGLVKITKQASEYTVSHELWHFLSDDDEDADPKPYTVFVQSLAFAPEANIPLIP